MTSVETDNLSNSRPPALAVTCDAPRPGDEEEGSRISIELNGVENTQAGALLGGAIEVSIEVKLTPQKKHAE